LNYNLL